MFYTKHINLNKKLTLFLLSFPDMTFSLSNIQKTWLYNNFIKHVTFWDDNYQWIMLAFCHYDKTPEEMNLQKEKCYLAYRFGNSIPCLGELIAFRTCNEKTSLWESVTEQNHSLMANTKWKIKGRPADTLTVTWIPFLTFLKSTTPSSVIMRTKLNSWAMGDFQDTNDIWSFLRFT